jgi:hypothetical protein
MSQTSPTDAERTASKDREHLKILAVFHFVGAGFALLGTGFLVLHYLLFRVFLTNPDLWEKGENPPDPQWVELFQSILVVFYFLGAVFLLAQMILNLLGGLYLLGRRHRIFCMVVAGINCLQVPLGLILGVFTLIVLSRDSVQELFARTTQRLR